MLTEFFQENALVIANTLFQQHKRRLYTWTSPDVQHQNQIDYILCSQRRRSSIQSAKTRSELTVTQIINSLLPNSDLKWNSQISAFRWESLSFSPFASLFFSAISKASSVNHFAFLHFLFLEDGLNLCLPSSVMTLLPQFRYSVYQI